jgi:hypothetical protein
MNGRTVEKWHERPLLNRRWLLGLASPWAALLLLAALLPIYGCGQRRDAAAEGTTAVRMNVPLTDGGGAPARPAAQAQPIAESAPPSAADDVVPAASMSELESAIGAGPGYEPGAPLPAQQASLAGTGSAAPRTTDAPRPATETRDAHEFPTATTAAPSEAPFAGPSPAALAAAEEAGRRLRLINAIVADVNGEVITREDLLRDLRSRMADWIQNLPELQFQLRVKDEMRERLIHQVHQMLLAQDAKRKSSEEFIKRLERRIAEERQRELEIAGGEAAWRALLARERLTEESWHRNQLSRYLIMSLVATEFSPRVSVTRQELVDYYEKIKAEEFTHADRARPQIIKLSRTDYPTVEAMMAAARSIISRARGGEDFEKLAAQFARAGATDWGFVGRDSFREAALNEALFTQPVGAVSDPIVTDDSVYIVRVAERVDGRVVPFTEVQTEIEQAVRRLKLDLMINEHINRLKERSYIRIYEENL